ncbi:MAG TPA: hypothetical protein VFE40_06460 [Jatrophihabitantaceae bacterium]|nr:hypothetical protein [Jatrophihabitantaceae bacterium]
MRNIQEASAADARSVPIFRYRMIKASWVASSASCSVRRTVREAMHARARGVEQRADRFGVAALGRRDELVARPGPPGASSHLSAQ